MKSKTAKMNALFGLLSVGFMLTFFSLLPAPPTQGQAPSRPGMRMENPTTVPAADAEVAPAPAADTTETPPEPSPSADDSKNIFAVLWAWIMANKEAAIAMLLFLLDAIVRLTPTEKDNNLLRIFQSWLDKVLPNRKKGGGRFAAFDDTADAPALAAVIPK
jgi:hypothetical protein